VLEQRRRRIVLSAVLVMALGLAAAVAWRMLSRPTDYERAVGSLPAGTLRATYTDWSAVRDLADGDGLDASSSRREVRAWLDRAFERDLVSTSAVAESAHALMTAFGASPVDAEWEVLGQGERGQVVVMSFGDDVDLQGVEQRLRRLGYDEPAGGPGSGGTWAGTPELAVSIDPSLTPVQQNFAVLPEDGLVVMSDQAAPVSAAVAVVRGEADAVDEGDLAGAAGEPVTAALWASDFACRDLSMTAADEEDQRVADELVARAGGVSPLTGLVIAQQPDRTVRVALELETEDQAEEDLQARVDLAAGEAPGQGGAFPDRFRVTEGERSGERVELELTPRAGAEFVFSDITSGPVLFATC
jgi:hypothetical protein